MLDEFWAALVRGARFGWDETSPDLGGGGSELPNPGMLDEFCPTLLFRALCGLIFSGSGAGCAIIGVAAFKSASLGTVSDFPFGGDALGGLTSAIFGGG